MNRTAKIWLLAAAILVLVGVVGFMGLMGANRWNTGILNTDRLVSRTVDLDGSFQNISIETDTDDISFQPSQDGKCRVEFLEWEKQPHTAAVQGDTLKITAEDQRSWLDHISVSLEGPKMTVYLPRTAYRELNIRESTGDIAIPADFLFDTIDLTVSTGDVRCAAGVTGQAQLRSSTGDFSLTDLIAGALSLSTDTGRIELQRVDCLGDLEIRVSTGRSVLTDVTCRNFTSRGSTGDVELENVTAEELIDIRRSTGDVRLDGCDAGELQIETDTGDVTGTLLTEKVFAAHSDTGHVQVPESTKGGACRVTTDTGRIELSIR